MPRILRTTLPDGYFHITARGVEQRMIYLDRDDCRSFLALFGATVRSYHWDLYAFCLMTNHWHIVVEATREELSNGVQWLNGVYAQQFNRRYGRWGHLFGGRFRSWVVESEEHLYDASKYVLEESRARQPVRARRRLAVERLPLGQAPRLILSDAGREDRARHGALHRGDAGRGR